MFFRRRQKESGEWPAERSALPPLWKIIVGAAIPMSLLIVYVCISYYFMNKRYEERLAAIHNAGFPINLEELQCWRDTKHASLSPPVADIAAAAFSAEQEPGEKAVDLCMRALALIADRTDSENSIGDKEARSLLERIDELSIDDWSRVDAWLDENSDALALLHAAVPLPPGYYSYDYSQGYEMECANRKQIKRAGRLLYFESIRAAIHSDPEHSVSAILACLRMIDPLRYEPSCLLQLVPATVRMTASSIMNDASKYGKFDEAHFARLQDAFESARNPMAFHTAMVGERTLVIWVYDKLLRDREYKNKFDRYTLGTGGSLIRLMGLLAWHYDSRMNFLSGMDDLLYAATLPYPDSVKIITRAVDASYEPSWFPMIHTVLYPAFARAHVAMAVGDAETLICATAAAIERHRAVHGILPDLLDELVGVYIHSVPEDPFDLQPLRYRKEADGYVLYSVGPDCVDDGGIQGATFSEGDLVFSLCP